MSRQKGPAAGELIISGLRPGLQPEKTSFDASGSRRFDLILDAVSTSAEAPHLPGIFLD